MNHRNFRLKKLVYASTIMLTSQCLLTEANTMKRRAAYPIDSLFTDRWSPRAMSGEQITDQELMTLFEAARWAPSSYNNQPWRFIYAKRDTAAWSTFFDLMVPFNQSWANTAGALVVIVSKDNFTFNGKPSRTAPFDTGAAVQNLALQGTIMGLVIHGMEGFDYDKAKEMLQIPDGYTVQAMFAVGRPGELKNLPKDLQERETLSDRNPVETFVAEGAFTESIK